MTESDNAAQSTTGQPTFDLDSASAAASYANFCRVGGGPEEVIVDFGLNPHPQGTPNEPIHISHRVVLSYYTAKRLLQVLHMTISQHERAFGPLEIDIRKRMVTQTPEENKES